MEKFIFRLRDKILEEGKGLSLPDALKLEEVKGPDLFLLMAAANQIREAFKGRHVILCSIVNAKSGLCSEDCAFCAQSIHHRTAIETFPLLQPYQILEKAKEAKRLGAHEFSIVTSGKGIKKEKEIQQIIEALTEIKKITSLKRCTSLGILPREYFVALKEGGLEIYHHNLEVSRSFFHNICSTHPFEEDYQTIKEAKEVGLKVCSGGIFGVGESFQQRVELAFTLKELDVDSIPLNFLIPIDGTRFEKYPLLEPLEALKIISLFRFIFPKKNIIVCGGREVVLKDLQSMIFLAGANGMILGHYLTTLGRAAQEDIKMIEALGLIC